MCSEYHVKTRNTDIEKSLAVKLINNAKDFEWGSTVKFYKDAPVILKNEDGDYELAMKSFPSSPMPNSRLSALEGQTDGNSDQEAEHTQIKRIYETKLWTEGFTKHPVLVPMTSFAEFAYWGPEKGTAQAFRIPNQEIMFAAGILIRPFTPKGTQNSGFSIITHTATKQMLEYHMRLIAVFENKSALGYLNDMSVMDRFNYILENRYSGKLEVEKIRNMAKGWERRESNQLRKLENEKYYTQVLKANNVLA